MEETGELKAKQTPTHLHMTSLRYHRIDKLVGASCDLLYSYLSFFRKITIHSISKAVVTRASGHNLVLRDGGATDDPRHFLLWTLCRVTVGRCQWSYGTPCLSYLLMRSWSQLSTPCHCFDSRVRTFLGFEIHFPGDGSHALALPGAHAPRYPGHLFLTGI